MAAPSVPAKTVRFRIKRQAGPQAAPVWEEFELAYRPQMNIIVALRDIAEKPVTRDGRATTTVAYDANCLEEVCGACAMIINGRARQACTALIDKLKQPISLEPLSRFPIIRDLAVDRSKLFRDLIRVKAWVPIDGTYALGPGPRQSPAKQQIAYRLSTCISCGNCLEVCPQYNSKTNFVGAAVISQVRLFNLHPTGEMDRAARLDALAGPGGIQECGYAQNCVRACPKGINLTESIAAENREMIGHLASKSSGG
ncbi:MAG: succinate dehydrogenase iron-sulfur subunit [Terriglobales bacterium]